jgi:hypothetical protein
MVVTLHASVKMPSILEVCFSTQKLSFVVEYRELCVAIITSEDYGSHD